MMALNSVCNGLVGLFFKEKIHLMQATTPQLYKSVGLGILDGQ